MSNQEQILKIIESSSQPLIVVSPESDLWHDLSSKIIEQMHINPADIIEFEPSEGVKQLREKISLLTLKPHSSKYRLFFIFAADELNREQINTLLKILEEPPPYSRTVLFAKVLSRILPTIKSRSKKYLISSNAKKELPDFLQDFLSLQFNVFLNKLNEVENINIPKMIEATLEALKKKGLNEVTLPLYQKLSDCLIRASSTNVNRKLIMEETFLWWKAQNEK